MTFLENHALCDLSLAVKNFTDARPYALPDMLMGILGAAVLAMPDGIDDCSTEMRRILGEAMSAVETFDRGEMPL
jgi:hypothetical protein